ncbi:hypothetical protein [Calothrix sp. CCY 0018]|uniref:hypothetical protein n=1 Tax=Calothrix sp. CCY 0018 TaxID=3103864 RepID=UPI0039C75A54
MSTLSYQALGEALPPGSIEFVGNNQLKANFSQITGNDLSLESSSIEGIVKLLRGIAKLTDQVNEARINQDLDPIEFASEMLAGTAEQPEYHFLIKVKVDTALFPDNLDDPTD